jgi:hypothetical protein
MFTHSGLRSEDGNCIALQDTSVRVFAKEVPGTRAGLDTTQGRLMKHGEPFVAV